MKWTDKLAAWRRHRGQKRREQSTAPHRGTSVVRCPRCRRLVADNERGRSAHRVSCVRIPKDRPRGWGEKEDS